jgi:hypothetical protein
MMTPSKVYEKIKRKFETYNYLTDNEACFKETMAKKTFICNQQKLPKHIRNFKLNLYIFTSSAMEATSHQVQWKPCNLCVPVFNHHLSSPSHRVLRYLLLGWWELDQTKFNFDCSSTQFLHCTKIFTMWSALFWDSMQQRLVVCYPCIPEKLTSHLHRSGSLKSRRCTIIKFSKSFV